MSIDAIDWTDVSEVTKGAFMTDFEMTTWGNGTTMALAANRYEDIGGTAYVITGGDETISTAAATTDGIWYVHVKDGGSGTATAYLDANAGTWSNTYKGFYYSGAKVIIKVYKNSTSFDGRQRRILEGELGQDGDIGDIKAVDLRVITAPDSRFWRLCDGTGNLPSAHFTGGPVTPTLNDSRFLMGDTAAGTGGANTINIQHNHQWYNYIGASSTDQSYNSGGSGINISSSVPTSGTKIETSTSGVEEALNSDFYTNNSLSTAQSIIPQYFKCKYYIKVY